MIARLWRSLACAMVALLCSVVVATAAPVYTFGTLPGSPTAGQLAWITDGNGTTTVGAAAAGGGAAMHLVAWDAGQSRWEFVMVGAPTSPPTADAATYLEGVQVSYDATISGLAAANVQAAIDELAATGAGAAHVVEDEGTPLTQRPAINFSGSGVSCADDAGNDASKCTMIAPIRTVVAALPGSPTITEQTYYVTDGAALNSCASGGGSFLVLCAWTGSAWQAIGGGGGGIVTGIAASSGGTTTGATVTLAQGTNVTTVRSGNTVTINAIGDGVGVSGITGGTGGTTSGSTVTLANGTNVTTVRSGDTVTINATGDGVGVSGIAGGSGGTTTGATVTLAQGSGVTTVRSADTVTISAPVNADHIDAITEIAAGLKSGADATLVTGTEGTSGNVGAWDANGDLVDGSKAAAAIVIGPGSATDNAIMVFDGAGGKTAKNSAVTITAGNISTAGSVAAGSFTTPDTDGTNALTIFGNASGDVTAPTGDDLSIFTKSDGYLYLKRPGQAATVSTMLPVNEWMYGYTGGTTAQTQAIAAGAAGTYPAPILYTVGGYNRVGMPAPTSGGFCTTASPTTNLNKPCTVNGDCGGGGVCGSLTAIIQLASIGYYDISFDASMWPTSAPGGRYDVCSGGTNAGQRCAIAGDCLGGGTCTGQTGDVTTTACTAIKLMSYADATYDNFGQMPVIAPQGQKLHTGSTSGRINAQLTSPAKTGHWSYYATAASEKIYFAAGSCGLAGDAIGWMGVTSNKQGTQFRIRKQ